jgi:hypothetical protein
MIRQARPRRHVVAAISMPESLVALLRRHYTLIAKDVLAPFVEVLAAGRGACGGDLDKLLIIMVVALRTAEHREIIDVEFEDVLSGAVERYPSLSTNVRSIADSTGIPKETVRRKVADLVEAGWIHRDGNRLALTPLASQMLTDVREPLLEMAVRNSETVRWALETPPRR